MADRHLAALDGVPLEIVSHGGDVRLLVGMPERLRNLVVRRLLTRATSWRFVSSSLLKHLTQSLAPADAGALAAMATVAPSPLSMIDVEEDVRVRRSTLGDRHLYVCAGRLVRSKRVDRVIDYVAGHRAAQPILVVIGDGPERARLEQLAYRWQLDVRFLGNTPRRETLTWIGAADELVHASVARGHLDGRARGRAPRREDHDALSASISAITAVRRCCTTWRPFSRLASVGSPHVPVGE